MDLSLSGSEELLRASVRDFVRREATTDVLVGLQTGAAGWRPEWSRVMRDAGWTGMLVPEQYGGSGASCLETALVVEELGRGPVPGPYLHSSVVATLLLLACAETAHRGELLAGVASGDVVLAPALLDPDREWNGLREIATTVTGSAEAGYVVDGTTAFVPFVEAATHLLVAVPVAAGTGFAAVPVTAPGVSWRRLEGFLAWNYEVTLAAVAVDALLVPEHGQAALDDALDRANAVLPAYAVGGSQVLLERSIDYSNTRRQFGQPIGRFQRVQDHIVELLNALDTARWATYEALWRVDSGSAPRASAHLAMALGAESYFRCADAAHEVHAGIGSDPTYGLTLFTQMSRSMYHHLGSPRWHRRRIGEEFRP